MWRPAEKLVSGAIEKQGGSEANSDEFGRVHRRRHSGVRCTAGWRGLAA